LIRGVTDKTGVSDRGTFLETPDASILENCPSQVGKAPELVPATKGEARMPAKVGYLAIDTIDPNGIAPFWCGLLGVHVDTTVGEGDFLILSPSVEGLIVGFQRVPEMKAGKNRVHLDLVVDDLDEATAEVEKLGGRWLEPENLKAFAGVA
jgi:hypothetical protein